MRYITITNLHNLYNLYNLYNGNDNINVQHTIHALTIARSMVYGLLDCVYVCVQVFAWPLLTAV